MVRRAGFWRIAAAVFTFINVGGAVYAAVNGEVMHASAHVGLLLATLFVWRAWSPRRQRGADDAIPAVDPQIDSQIDRLQYSLDAIALEVERIGEGQRFINKLQQEQSAESVAEKEP